MESLSMIQYDTIINLYHAMSAVFVPVLLPLVLPSAHIPTPS